MKRFFFSLIALSAAAVGCTQSAMLETPENFSQEVSFSPYTGRTPETKATSIETAVGLANASSTADAKADPNGFYVYGFLNKVNGDNTTTSLYMNKEKVYSPSKGSTANDWKYDNLVYWPDGNSGSSLSFVAYSANASAHLSNASDAGFTFTVPQNVTNQVDLLATAYQEGLKVNDADNGKITLNFHHLLSRVGFKIQASQSNSNRMIKITNLAIKGKMPESGSLTFTDAKGTQTPVLNPSTTDFTDGYTLISSATEIASSTNVTPIPNNDNRYMMIVPHDNENDDHYIEVTYAIGTTSDQTTTYSTAKTVTLDLPSNFSFAAGKAYEFILQISTSKLSFDVVEQPWDTDDYDNDDNKDNNHDYPLEPENQNAVTLGSALVADDNTVKIPITVNKENLYEIKVQYCVAGSNGTWTDCSTTINKTVGATTTVELKQLASNTEYNYRASVILAQADTETYYYPTENSELSFMTYADVVFDYGTLTKDKWKESNVTPFTANVTAVYSSDNQDSEYAITEYGFCWVRGSVAPTVNDFKQACTEANGGKYTMIIQNLADNTEYSIRAYVKNKKGKISYSENLNFKTKYYYEDPNDDTGAGGLTPAE